MTNLKPITRAEWIAALRSEKYKQGTGYLKLESEHCCLGVACDLAGVDLESLEAENVDSLGTCDFEVVDAGDLYGWLNLDINTNTILADMNDAGYSFEQIANVLERLDTIVEGDAIDIAERRK